MRRIFVGDIQGCLAQLEQLLAKLRFQPGEDTLYPVGDLVNKGPDSSGTLALLMGLDAQPVLGNHDVAWLDRGLVTDRDQERWLRMQPFARVMADLIVVHAGLHPEWTDADVVRLAHKTGAAAGFGDDDVRFAITVRYCDAGGALPESDWPPPPAPFQPWHQFYAGERRVVYGHWARQGLHRGDRVIGLDSGCVYGNELTAWIAEEDRIVQVPGPARE